MRQKQARWGSKRILFVSGKGGVGKSLIAAAIAHQQVLAGRKVLLAELGETSYYKDYWNLPHVGHEPVRHKDGFDLALWSGESCLREYVLHFLRMERLYKLFFENKVMRALVNVAPGLNEISILGKITSGLRRVGPPLEYDVIVVDAYATGHAMALFEAPRGMMEAVKFGPMGSQSREMNEILRHPDLCSYVLVTIPEEMPVVETLEFREALKRELGVESEIVCNRVLPIPTSVYDLEKIVQENRAGVSEFARYLLAVQDRQKNYLIKLRREAHQVFEVPVIFSTNPDELMQKAGEALRQI